MTEEDGFFKPLSETTVAIIGLGLIGGSLAMSLHGACKKLIGCDTDQSTIKLARKMQIVDFVDSEPESVLPKSRTDYSGYTCAHHFTNHSPATGFTPRQPGCFRYRIH